MFLQILSATWPPQGGGSLLQGGETIANTLKRSAIYLRTVQKIRKNLIKFFKTKFRLFECKHILQKESF
jgi:hypothetical protein